MKISRRIRSVDVVYTGPWPASAAVVESLRSLYEEIPSNKIWLHVYYTSMKDLLGGVGLIARPLKTKSLSFYGDPFDVDEDCANTLVRSQVKLNSVLGWPGSESSFSFDTLSQNCMLGLRIPGCIYATNENIGEVLELSRKYIEVSYNSGVSLLPIHYHPRYSEQLLNRVPDHEEFAACLVNIYSKFRNYDDVFEPVVSLSENVRLKHQFGLHSSEKSVGFLVDEEGLIRRFRLIPSAGVELRSGEESLAYDSQLSQNCKSCSVFDVCGGCDVIDEKLLSVVCHHRTLFGKHFAKQLLSLQER